MNQPFEIIEVERKKRLVVLVEAPPFLMLRYATWWERFCFAWNKSRDSRKEWKANVATEMAIKRAAAKGIS